jgi:hypothetical protein
MRPGILGPGALASSAPAAWHNGVVARSCRYLAHPRTVSAAGRALTGA